jgi:ketosteroid isomerase-like protein
VDYEAHVRKMWAAFQRDGIAGMRPYVDEDVEFTPTDDSGTIRGFDALAAYWHDRGAKQSVVPHAWEQHGDCVLVHGSLRMFRDGGFVDTQPSWVYFFDDGKLSRAIAYASREEALAAIYEHCGGRVGGSAR